MNAFIPPIKDERSMSSLLIFHIATASIALLGGVAAMSLRKGSAGHRTGGTVFVIGMICMTVSAIPLGLLKTQTLNALVGALTCYLVASGWVAGRRNPLQDVRTVNAALAVVALGVGALLVKFGFEALNSPSHLKDGEDASGYFFFGAIAVLSAALDLRLVIAGIGNKHRIARHLWRMNLAMAIGIISVTPRLNRLAGHPIQSDVLLVAPTLLVLLFMVFWLWRVLATKRGGERRPRSVSERLNRATFVIHTDQ
jgi:uncharacterized membrane protein